MNIYIFYALSGDVFEYLYIFGFLGDEAFFFGEKVDF